MAATFQIRSKLGIITIQDRNVEYLHRCPDGALVIHFASGQQITLRDADLLAETKGMDAMEASLADWLSNV